MTMTVIDTPWALVQESLPLRSGETASVSGVGSPRVISEESSRIKLKGNHILPAVSFPFYWGDEVRQSYCLPTNAVPCGLEREKEFLITASTGEAHYEIIQNDIVGRFKNDDSPLGVSQSVTSWIGWVINCFQSLTHMDEAIELEVAFEGLVRRQWNTVAGQFLRTGSEDALMSLIVKISGDRQLKTILKSISGNPRKVLKRVREELALSRIQQLDAACIRDFARRPGRDAPEKAGPRQKLLALNRVENTDTLENRVSAWVLETLDAKSKAYINENKHHKNSPRVRDVRRLGFNSVNWRRSEGMSSVITGELNHPVMPNYPLQLDRRYRKIYQVYKLLLQDQKVHDDAWGWQRNLWACSARAVLYSRLTQKYEQRFSSCSVIRGECQRGNWFESAVAPGPFTIGGQTCYLIDSLDIVDDTAWLHLSLFKGAEYVGMSGCDSIMYFPKSGKLILIWFYYWTGSAGDFLSCQESCYDAIQQIQKTIEKRKGACPDLSGFVISSSMKSDSLSFDSYKNKLTLISIPAKSHDFTEELDAALELVLGA